MRIVKWGLAVIVVIGLATGIWLYIKHSERYPSTEDAYVSADTVHVAAQVPGPVTSVYVADQNSVHKGQRLFEIDAEPYRLAVQQNEARVTLAAQQVAEDEAAVTSAAADVNNREVLLKNAKQKLERAQALAHKHYTSTQAVDDAQAAYRSAQAVLNLSQAKLNEARKQLGTNGERNARIREAQAALGKAQWDLAHTKVNAACDGHIAEFNLHAGDTVATGQPLFVLICAHSYTVRANYKETDIAAIRPGQAADITIDMYPGRHFKGRVESINGASGVAFSLLPPQNATGNWVKVTQRVPVKIRISDSKHHLPLRVGTSAVVTIDTAAHTGHPESGKLARE